MALAKIEWIIKKKGGRRVPPNEKKYCPVVRFIGHGDTFWSFLIVNSKRTDAATTVSDVYFLLENAPWHLLSEGVEFAVYEGNKHVGNGVILPYSNKWEICNDWFKDSYLRIVLTPQNRLEIQGNKNGLLCFARQIKSIALSEGDDRVHVHYDAVRMTDSGDYDFGVLEDDSLDLVINKVNLKGDPNDFGY
ncbi:MAG: hypothetical protein LBP62_08470 [Clostridiales bacterium]|jgi:hypothetical protein|nr:hypothetical protein [Clostridiales bacterium]